MYEYRLLIVFFFFHKIYLPCSVESFLITFLVKKGQRLSQKSKKWVGEAVEHGRQHRKALEATRETR